MAVLQLLLHKSAERVDLEAVENPDLLPPSEFGRNDPQTKPYRVGTQALLELAWGLREYGFIVQAIDLRDEYDQVLPDSEWQGRIVEDLRNGKLKQVRAFFDGPGDGVFVFGVELFDTVFSSSVDLRRDGVVVLLGTTPATRIVDALESVWWKRRGE